MNKAFTEIAAGLDNAIAHAKGEKTNVVEHSYVALIKQILLEHSLLKPAHGVLIRR